MLSIQRSPSASLMNVAAARRKLEAIRDECAARLAGGRRENTSAEAGDDADVAARSEQHELSMGDVHRLRVKLKSVTAALNRVHDGTYGECLTCEEPIAAARLAAIPWVEMCIDCASKLERDR